jgi:hypothetical protein
METSQQNNKVKKSIICVLIIATIFTVFAIFSLKNHESDNKEEICFTIDKPYISVVKDLATKNSLEKIVEDHNGSITHKNWERFDVEIPKRILRIKQYKIYGCLKFTIEKKDKNIGNLTLPFIQEFHLDDKIFNVETELINPQENILLYSKNIEITPKEENGLLTKTNVCIKSELKVKKLIPFFFSNYMDEKVKQNNINDLKKLKNNIENISSQSKITLKFN